MRGLRPIHAVIALSLAGGCDSSPSGPGQLSARASAPALGAVVLEVEGRGITGFAAQGTSRVYSAPVQGRAGVHRVIVVSPAPGSLSFTIDVDDVGMEGPVVTVVSAADGANVAMSASRVAVTVER